MPSVPGLSFPMDTPQNLYLVGPLILEIKEKIDEDLEEWLGNQSVVIYVSFGTTGHPSPELWEKLIEGFKQTEYSFLISARDRNHSLLSSLLENDSKFALRHWVAQKMVLQHPSVKVFVNHCGFGSVTESIYYRKPILAIPFYFDQPDVAARVTDNNLGISLDGITCTPHIISNSLKVLVVDESYTKNATKFAIIMRTAGGVKRAADICVEEMLCGSSHLQSRLPPPFITTSKLFAFIFFVLFLTFYQNQMISAIVILVPFAIMWYRLR